MARMSADDYISGDLRDRITVFLDDLQNFNESTLLENYRDSTFMSSTYFTDDEIDRLQSLTIRGKPLKEKLDDIIKKRADCDGEICSSHDLKPIYERYFGFTKSDMRKPKIKNARESWSDWRTSSVVSEAFSVSDVRETLTKKINKAKKKNRKKEVAKLEELLANTRL